MLSSFEVVSFRSVLLISLSKTAALLLLDSSLFLCLFKRSQRKLGLDRAGHMEWIRARVLKMCFRGSAGKTTLRGTLRKEIPRCKKKDNIYILFCNQDFVVLFPAF